MAPNTITKKTLLLAILIFTLCSQFEAILFQDTKLIFYLQSKAREPNATTAVITGIPGKLWNFFSFGTLFAEDDVMTETMDPRSAQLGRAQGFYCISSLDGSIANVILELVLTDKKYNGSTIQIQGASVQLDDVREVAVTGGTGKFRYGRGYATLETVFLDGKTGANVIRLNVTVNHSLL